MKMLEPEDWKRVEVLLDRLLDQPVEARAAMLDEACDGDEGIRARVEDILQAGEEAASFLGEAYREKLLNELQAARADPEAEGVWKTKTIGAYRLLNLIGKGGMGQVFRAVRSDDALKQYVAVKVIRRGMETEEVQVRFRVERQILASLNHPNIARLLDGGVTEDGISYLVMSYIEGIPITKYCSEKRLSIEERLGLFRKVCEAVQYAHRNLIVHRDLKPSNILVTPEGVVKLLDFGIAKLLNPEMVGYTVPMTRSELRIMTPEYASPEQVRGEPVTTSSDVYALGILLYELLTGRHPYPLSSLRRAELERFICEVDPAPPSNSIGKVEGSGVEGSGVEEKAPEAVSPEAVSPEEISQMHGIPHERLRRSLQGDLDNIVMMALRKEPARRYPSVEALQEDIKRYLGGLPVKARRATVGYRMNKFIGRHRWGVVTGIAFVLLLTTAAMIAVRFAVVTSKQSQRIELEAEKARQVKQFLVRMFEEVDPMQAQGQEVTARELLDRGSIHIKGELMNQPEVKAEMLHVMGVVYRKLGMFNEAYNLLDQALILRRSEYGDEHLEVANTLFELGWLVDDMGVYGKAEELHREALAIRRKLLAPDHPDIAASLNDLGVVLYGKGNLNQAREILEEALITRKETLGNEHPGIAETMLNLAVIVHDEGRYLEAEKLYRNALDIQMNTLQAEELELTTGLISYASLLYDLEEFEDAEVLLREVLALRRGIFEEGHYYVAWAQEWLARVLHSQGKDEEAELLFYQVLEKRVRGLGSSHVLVGRSLIDIGAFMIDNNMYTEAEELLLRSIDIIDKSVGKDHYYMAAATFELGRLYNELGRYKEAKGFMKQSLDYYIKWNFRKKIDRNQEMLMSISEKFEQ